jgi:hypothetical protein
VNEVPELGKLISHAIFKPGSSSFAFTFGVPACRKTRNSFCCSSTSEAGIVADKARLYACIKKKSAEMAIANEIERTQNAIAESRLEIARVDDLVI